MLYYVALKIGTVSFGVRCFSIQKENNAKTLRKGKSAEICWSWYICADVYFLTFCLCEELLERCLLYLCYVIVLLVEVSRHSYVKM